MPAKSSIRKSAIIARDSIDAGIRARLDKTIASKIAALSSFAEAKRIFIYAAYKSEAGTEGIIQLCFDMGKQVVLPKVNSEDKTLSKHIISGMHEVCTGYMGIPEPTTDNCIKVEEVDIIIVPGVAFSENGDRIGYGGGYYDRLLPRIKGQIPIIALAYEAQIVQSIKAEKHDIGMDIIVTPERVINCNG